MSSVGTLWCICGFSLVPVGVLKVPSLPKANLFQSFFISCILLQLEAASPLLPFTSLRPPPSDPFLLFLSTYLPTIVSLLNEKEREGGEINP
ncbi:hypothetical protein F5Y12DRAFT_745385 [Xylaria sp. FL1777]|nr:hypothetical protein F5Y12DRAFT_745385 [Xylaria sp. FL1777]